MKRLQIRLSTLRKEQKELDRAFALVNNEFHQSLVAGKRRKTYVLSYILTQLDRRQDFLNFGYISYGVERK